MQVIQLNEVFILLQQQQKKVKAINCNIVTISERIIPLIARGYYIIQYKEKGF